MIATRLVMLRKLHAHSPQLLAGAGNRSKQAPQRGQVWVVDDDASVRRSMARLLQSSGFEVKTFESAQACLDLPPCNGPLCLVLDLNMPGLDGLKLQQEFAGRDTRIVFVTGYGDIPKCTQAMKAGAVDFLTKPVDARTLIAAITTALEKSADLRRTRGEKTMARSRINTLTPREFEVLQGVISGLLNKQIAANLGAAVKTIKVHRGRVMSKMGVVSVAELVREAQIAGITTDAHDHDLVTQS